MNDPNIPALSITRLSIVIPVGPGDTTWRGLVEQLSQLATRSQLLLVFADGDAQSTDVPEHCVALSAPAGRAHQLNAGIAAAEAQWLWLLHADSRLQLDTLPSLLDYLAVDNDAADQTEPAGFVGVNSTTGKDQIHGLRLTHNPGQPLGPADSGDDA